MKINMNKHADLLRNSHIDFIDIYRWGLRGGETKPHMKLKRKQMNNLIIGTNAGADLVKNVEGLVIIGDDIRDMTQPQDGVLFLSDTVAIGQTIGGVECNLQDILVNKYSEI